MLKLVKLKVPFFGCLRTILSANCKSSTIVWGQHKGLHLSSATKRLCQKLALLPKCSRKMLRDLEWSAKQFLVSMPKKQQKDNRILGTKRQNHTWPQPPQKSSPWLELELHKLTSSTKSRCCKPQWCLAHRSIDKGTFGSRIFASSCIAVLLAGGRTVASYTPHDGCTLLLNFATNDSAWRVESVSCLGWMGHANLKEDGSPNFPHKSWPSFVLTSFQSRISWDKSSKQPGKQKDQPRPTQKLIKWGTKYAKALLCQSLTC